jgi:hypothetical protein
MAVQKGAVYQLAQANRQLLELVHHIDHLHQYLLLVFLRSGLHCLQLLQEYVLGLKQNIQPFLVEALG